MIALLAALALAQAEPALPRSPSRDATAPAAPQRSPPRAAASKPPARRSPDADAPVIEDLELLRELELLDVMEVLEPEPDRRSGPHGRP